MFADTYAKYAVFGPETFFLVFYVSISFIGTYGKQLFFIRGVWQWRRTTTRRCERLQALPGKHMSVSAGSAYALRRQPAPLRCALLMRMFYDCRLPLAGRQR